LRSSSANDGRSGQIPEAKVVEEGARRDNPGRRLPGRPRAAAVPRQPAEPVGMRSVLLAAVLLLLAAGAASVLALSVVIMLKGLLVGLLVALRLTAAHRHQMPSAEGSTKPRHRDCDAWRAGDSLWLAPLMPACVTDPSGRYSQAEGSSASRRTFARSEQLERESFVPRPAPQGHRCPKTRARDFSSAGR